MDKLCDRETRQTFHVNIDGAFEHLLDGAFEYILGPGDRFAEELLLDFKVTTN